MYYLSFVFPHFYFDTFMFVLYDYFATYIAQNMVTKTGISTVDLFIIYKFILRDKSRKILT